MKVIEGKYQKGAWFHDPDAYDEEDIAFLNEAFRTIGQADPRFLKLIWQPQKQRPALRRVK